MEVGEDSEKRICITVVKRKVVVRWSLEKNKREKKLKGRK